MNNSALAGRSLLPRVINTWPSRSSVAVCPIRGVVILPTEMKVAAVCARISDVEQKRNDSKNETDTNDLNNPTALIQSTSAGV
jgi:hypothetical protein